MIDEGVAKGYGSYGNARYFLILEILLEYLWMPAFSDDDVMRQVTYRSKVWSTFDVASFWLNVRRNRIGSPVGNR